MDIKNFDLDFFNDLLEKASLSPRMRMNYDLRTSDSDGSQRMFNAVIKGVEFPVHRHRGTAESIVALSGVMEEVFYDDNGNETNRFTLDPKNGKVGLQIPAGQWHTLIVRESGITMEMKDGPYEPLKPEDILEIR